MNTPHISLRRNQSNNDSAKFDSLAEDVSFLTTTQQILQDLRAKLGKTIQAGTKFVSRDTEGILGESDERTSEVLMAKFDEITTSIDEMERTLQELSEIESDIQIFRVRVSHIHSNRCKSTND